MMFAMCDCSATKENTTSSTSSFSDATIERLVKGRITGGPEAVWSSEGVVKSVEDMNGFSYPVYLVLFDDGLKVWCISINGALGEDADATLSALRGRINQRLSCLTRSEERMDDHSIAMYVTAILTD